MPYYDECDFSISISDICTYTGCLLDGIDRIISARMQCRKGPKLLQPFYDLGKLFSKENIAVNNAQLVLALSYLVVIMIVGAMLFAGADILMMLFVLSTADIFLIIAAACSSSPYANIGANRETLLTMAYEPITLLVAMGFYLTTGSFYISDIIQSDFSAVVCMPGLLIGFMFIATIKFRKSPFDLATSHHAHQEIVKGITTEMSGTTLAIVDIAEYYENILLFSDFRLVLCERRMVQLDNCYRIMSGVLFPGDIVRQCCCACKMESAPSKLLDSYSDSRRN